MYIALCLATNQIIYAIFKHIHAQPANQLFITGYGINLTTY